MKTLAIMQPTFLPWLGYFSLIQRVDEFVFLDNVQFDRRSFQQRNRLKTDRGPRWVTIPVSVKGKREQKIDEVKIIFKKKFGDLSNINEMFRHAYGKAKYYQDYKENYENIFLNAPPFIANLNEIIIRRTCNYLEINTPIILASQLQVSGTKDKLLKNICLERNAAKYISPIGAMNYLDNSKEFKLEGIEVIYHHYNHPSYDQMYGKFTPYMCILDLLYNEGPKSMEIINSGLKIEK